METIKMATAADSEPHTVVKLIRIGWLENNRNVLLTVRAYMKLKNE